jgi:hypothetical protein
MISLVEQSHRIINSVRSDYKRFLYYKINWNNRLIGIKGARGTGKTTIVLQWLKSLNLPASTVLYLSLDDIYFSSNSLKETVDLFYKQGGKILGLDEVHKYRDWSLVVKNIYDFYPELKIIFTGSSIIELSKQKGDLSRRVIMYDLPGLSYREYLGIKNIAHFNPITLAEILENKVSGIMDQEFRPLTHFQNYLNYGYYPFGIDNEEDIYQRINQLVRTIVEVDMAAIESFDVRNAPKMLQLISIIAKQVPFKPNISELSEKTGIHRNTLNSYLYYLEQAKIIMLLFPAGISSALLKKPEKVLFNNTTLLSALGNGNINKGTLRETFFLSQISSLYKVHYPKSGDFMVDEKYVFEIGGKTKSQKQLTNIGNSFVVADDLEYSVGNKLPLWLFGFLY